MIKKDTHYNTHDLAGNKYGEFKAAPLNPDNTLEQIFEENRAGLSWNQATLDAISAYITKREQEAKVAGLEAFDEWVKDLADDQVYTIVSAFIKTYIENELTK